MLVAMSVYKQRVLRKKTKIIVAFLGSNFNIQKNWEKQAVQLKSDIDSSKSIVRALKLSISMIFTRN